MSPGMKEDLVLQMGTDKTIERHVYDKPFMVRCPERSEWEDRFQSSRKVQRRFQDEGTEAGVYG
jgi:hypothetical protein